MGGGTYLRHEVAWYICWHGRTVQRWSTGVWHHRKHNHWDSATQCQDPRPRLEIEPADNNQVPSEVARVGEQGWYRLVVDGLGCPFCYRRPEHQREVRPDARGAPEELDPATEGQFGHLLL